MAGDAALIEASLIQLAELGIELRHTLFERFFTAFPDRQAAFLCPEATSVRMTDETLQILYGLALEEAWVWPLIAELVGTHRSYGTLPLTEYDAFIDLTIDQLAVTLGPAWNKPCAAAWGRQAARFKVMIADATGEWDRVLPQAADV